MTNLRTLRPANDTALPWRDILRIGDVAYSVSECSDEEAEQIGAWFRRVIEERRDGGGAA